MITTLTIFLCIALVAVSAGCSATQPPDAIRTSYVSTAAPKMAEAMGITGPWIQATTMVDGEEVRSTTNADLSKPENRSAHEQTVQRLVKGRPDKPIANGKAVELIIQLNGTNDGNAPTSMTVVADRSGTLRIELIWSATAQVQVLQDAPLVVGRNEIPLNLAHLPNGSYMLRVREEAMVRNVSFSVAR